MGVMTISGTPYFNPDGVDGAGGDEMLGVANRRAVLDPDIRTEIQHCEGRVSVVRVPGDEPVITIPLHDAHPLAVKRIFALLTNDGETISAEGVIAPFEECPGVAVLIVPGDPSKKYIYAPNCKLHPESARIIVFDEEQPQFPESLILVCCDPDLAELGEMETPDASENVEKWMHADADDIVTEYGLDPADGTPLITLDTAVLDLGSVAEGVAGSAHAFGVVGRNLSADITVGPVTGLQFSKNGAAGTYTATQTLVRTNGRVDATIHARFAATALAGVFYVAIPATSAGATTKNVMAAGEVI